MTMEPLESARLLVFSGAAAILFSSIMGFAMLIPLQPWGRAFMKGLNYKQIGAAHLDWIILGLMQGLGAGVVMAFALKLPIWPVAALIAGGWLNPLPYLFRGFGLNAFEFAGGIAQRAAAGLGLLSSIAIVYAWIVILSSAWEAWP